MRLLYIKDDGGLVWTKDLIRDKDIPPYAILSHTWEDQEVTFDDFKSLYAKEKAGLRKIDFCARQASRDSLRYIWVDTCCIDKSNHTELSAAINSMFRWYKKAQVCYVYLADISSSVPVWETATGHCCSVLEGDSDGISAVVFSPDRQLGVGDGDGTLSQRARGPLCQ
jgi:WD40 repeat protein